MSRAVIIGAGVGGLAAAARLATLGHAVVVCEQRSTVGGKVGSYTHDGFTFDTGPSLLTLPAVYRDLFNKTGTPLEAHVDLVPVEPAFHYRFADGVELDVPNASRGGLIRALDDALGDGAGQQWNALLARGEAIWSTTREAFLESPLGGVGDLARLARSATDIRTVAPWKSLRGLGKQYLRDWRLRQMLDRYATYAGSDPRRVPAALGVIPYVEAAFGAWHVRGGLRALALAVHDRATERGAVVRTGTPVVAITLDAGQVSGVRLADGSHLPADVVVANADAATVYNELLPAEVAARPLARLRAATPSLSGVVLLLALRGRTPGIRHHTVLFPHSYDDEFDAVFGRGAHPVEDPAVYVCVPADQSMHNADGEAMFVLVNAPRDGREGEAGTYDWSRDATPYAERVLEVMAERGLDVRDRVLWREVRTPADLARETGAPGGAIYGTSSNGRRAAFLRPANRSPVPGLFLVGGSAHPGGGLPLVGLSAAIVAELVGRA